MANDKGIQDFGEKIGGARKDVWADAGVHVDDLVSMTDAERIKYAKKEYIWPRPDFEAEIKNGVSQTVAYWQNEMRKAIPPVPQLKTYEVNDVGAMKIAQENYVDTVTKLKDAVMSVVTKEQMISFYDDHIEGDGLVIRQANSHFVERSPEAASTLNQKIMKTSQVGTYDIMMYERAAQKALFGVPEDRKEYEKAKSRLAVLYIDGEKTKLDVEMSNLNRTVLSIRSGLGTTFMYMYRDGPGAKFYEPTQWINGTYFVVDKDANIPVKNGFGSKEAAEEYREALAKAAQVKEIVKQPSEDEKKRKMNFVPPQLDNIDRTTKDALDGKHADGDMFLQDYKFRGGEFGNWVSEKERQISMDMAFDAFADLAAALHMTMDDVSLGGKLAIAFGSRGRGGASAGAAHYEPDLNVINLTRMKGAGCLAHEWGHALDAYIGTLYGAMPGQLATDCLAHGNGKQLPEAFAKIVDAMKHKQVLMTADEQKAAKQNDIERNKEELDDWLAYVKPGFLKKEYTAMWDDAISKVKAVEGVPLSSYGMLGFVSARDETTVPEIEELSKVSRLAGHAEIDKKYKVALSECLYRICRSREQMNNLKPEWKTVDTQFYEESCVFDSTFKKTDRGYWASDPEMFARAFDCYISDKLKSAGVVSQYLTAHSDSYILPPAKDSGEVKCAFPVGDERRTLDACFDSLLETLKQRDVLHDDPTMTLAAAPEATIEEEVAKTIRSAQKMNTTSKDKGVQMSFDDFM